MDLGLRGKHAIVTGGSLGIGKAIARELAREGVDVAIVARTKDQLEATARELAAETGRRIIPLAVDVTSKGSLIPISNTMLAVTMANNQARPCSLTDMPTTPTMVVTATNRQSAA